MDDEFFLRLGKIGDGGGAKLAGGRGFVGEVLRAARRGGLGALGGGSRRPGRSGRGRLTTARSSSARRRVIVKGRIIRHRGGRYRAAPLAMHIRYLRREGVTREGGPAEMFDRDGVADAGAFATRCEDDRHHFRFIVSPEDAAALRDLRATIRELMEQAERDLGTRLDWVAIDHWNTDNPHVHVLVRGVGDDGRDLVIDGDYITQGLRQRAEALVSLELGPRTAAEIESSLNREVDAERWTSLDRRLRDRVGPNGWIDLRPDHQGQGAELRLIGRAQHLQRLGLADAREGRWRLADDLEGRLRELALRGDIIKTLHAAMGQRGGDLTSLQIHGAELERPIVGRLVDRGLHDELTGVAYAVVEGLDGRTHHFRFADLAATGDTRVGGLVEVRGRQEPDEKPKLDLIHRSDLSLEAQVEAAGSTWLDRQLVAREPEPLARGGLGASAREALDARRDHLRARGLTDAAGRPRPGLINTLRQAELDRVAANIAAETGLAHSPVKPGDDVAGVYRRRMDLVSGRFAMIEDGLGFQLVPWSRGLDRQLGQAVRGTGSPGGGIDWAFGRKRGIGL